MSPVKFKKRRFLPVTKVPCRMSILLKCCIALVLLDPHRLCLGQLHAKRLLLSVVRTIKWPAISDNHRLLVHLARDGPSIDPEALTFCLFLFIQADQLVFHSGYVGGVDP